jgi:hypothetical protein
MFYFGLNFPTNNKTEILVHISLKPEVREVLGAGQRAAVPRCFPGLEVVIFGLLFTGP